ncbi:hypothetical protein [Streptomyces bobili]|uniref:hypothetical protein n=1 Tax=Streptomyces bobili TaxID=67280 RepID=UPI003721FCEE
MTSPLLGLFIPVDRYGTALLGWHGQGFEIGRNQGGERRVGQTRWHAEAKARCCFLYEYLGHAAMDLGCAFPADHAASGCPGDFESLLPGLSGDGLQEG